MVNLLLRNISLQERQERVGLSRSRSDVTGVSGGGRRSGNGFRHIVLSELRSEVGGKGRSLRWSGSRKLFYGADVIIGSLNNESGGFRMRFLGVEDE
jgi:hypothetical protein